MYGKPAWSRGLKCPQLSRENNGMYGKHHSNETKKKQSVCKLGKPNPKLSDTMKRLYKEGKLKVTKETKTKLKLIMKEKYKKGELPPNVGAKGKNNPSFNNYSSFEPYGLEFNEKLREQIRARDNYRCQECFREQDELRTKTNKKYKLMIHHINFNKQNNNPNNLISLCRNCHSQTNFGRDKWTQYFQDKIRGISQLIKKDMGGENKWLK